MVRLFLAVSIVLLSTLVSVAVPVRPGSDLSTPPLRWNKNTIRIAVSQSITTPNVNIKYNSDVVKAISSSLKVWESAANVSFELSYIDKLNVSSSGPAGDGVSLITIAQTPDNVLLFDKGATDASARTRVFVDRRGFITEGDIVLNPFQSFSTDGTPGSYDLQSVLTHELGHLLGLDHSPVFGSTMFEGIGKNGAFNLQNRFARTLSTEDIAAIRSLYGPAVDDENCCGRIVGKLAVPRNAKDLKVWAEDHDSGAVVGFDSVGTDGTFQIGGLTTGKYRLLVQNSTNSRVQTAAYELPAVEVSKDNIAKVSESLKLQPIAGDVRYIGTSEQLGTIALPLNRGRIYTLLVGGNKRSGNVEIGSDSQYIEVDPQTAGPTEWNDSTSAIRVSVRIRPDAPMGDYSLYIKDENGLKRYLTGAITVEAFEDPSVFIFSTGY